MTQTEKLISLAESILDIYAPQTVNTAEKIHILAVSAVNDWKQEHPDEL